MSGFLAVIIGCLECQESSHSLGIFTTEEAAREACAAWLWDQGMYVDGTVFGSWVLDLSAQQVHRAA